MQNIILIICEHLSPVYQSFKIHSLVSMLSVCRLTHDLQRQFLEQHSLATLLWHCFERLQHSSNIAMGHKGESIILLVLLSLNTTRLVARFLHELPNFNMCFRTKHHVVKIFNLPFMLWRELSAKVDFEKHCTFQARSNLLIVVNRSSKRDRFPGDILKSCSNISNNFNPLVASSVFLRGMKSTTANFKVSKSLPEMYDESSTRNFL